MKHLTFQIKGQKIFFIPKSSNNSNNDTVPLEYEDKKANNIVILPIGANLTSLPLEILRNFLSTDKYDTPKPSVQLSSYKIFNNSHTEMSISEQNFSNSASKNASPNSSNLCPICMDNISGNFFIKRFFLKILC